MVSIDRWECCRDVDGDGMEWWSFGFAILIGTYIAGCHVIPHVGMSEAIKSWSMTFCLVGEEGSQILCVPTLQLPGRDLYAGTGLCVERFIQLGRSTDIDTSW